MAIRLASFSSSRATRGKNPKKLCGISRQPPDEVCSRIGKLRLVVATFGVWNIISPETADIGGKMPTGEPKGLDKGPKCVRCDSEMRFSCTEPDKPGFVHHVYECRKCSSTQSFVTPVKLTN